MNSLSEKFWFEDMKFCGCGAPEDVRKWIATQLQAIDDEKFMESDLSEAEWFMLYVFDAMGLTGHGGNVSGSWLSDKGKNVLKTLREE